MVPSMENTFESVQQTTSLKGPQTSVMGAIAVVLTDLIGEGQIAEVKTLVSRQRATLATRPEIDAAPPQANPQPLPGSELPQVGV